MAEYNLYTDSNLSRLFMVSRKRNHYMTLFATYSLEASIFALLFSHLLEICEMKNSNKHGIEHESVYSSFRK